MDVFPPVLRESLRVMHASYAGHGWDEHGHWEWQWRWWGIFLFVCLGSLFFTTSLVCLFVCLFWSTVVRMYRYAFYPPFDCETATVSRRAMAKMIDGLITRPHHKVMSLHVIRYLSALRPHFCPSARRSSVARLRRLHRQPMRDRHHIHRPHLPRLSLLPLLPTKLLHLISRAILFLERLPTCIRRNSLSRHASHPAFSRATYTMPRFTITGSRTETMNVS